MAQTAASWTWISACRAEPARPKVCRSPSSMIASWPWCSWPSWRSTARLSRPAPIPLPARTLVFAEVRSGLFMAGLQMGAAEFSVRGAVGKDRGAFEQQAQRLPVDAKHGLGAHPGEGQQVAMQAGAVEFDTAQAEAGLEQLVGALPVLHVHHQALAGLAVAHAVFQFARQEGRD